MRPLSLDRQKAATVFSGRLFLLPTHAPMAAAVAVETLTVALGGREENMTVLSFLDRRSRPYRRKQWLLIRGIERLLFNVGEFNRSTGAFAAHLNKCTMRHAVLCCEKARVNDQTITDAELGAGK